MQNFWISVPRLHIITYACTQLSSNIPCRWHSNAMYTMHAVSHVLSISKTTPPPFPQRLHLVSSSRVHINGWVNARQVHTITTAMQSDQTMHHTQNSWMGHEDGFISLDFSLDLTLLQYTTCKNGTSRIREMTMEGSFPQFSHQDISKLQCSMESMYPANYTDLAWECRTSKSPMLFS